jgi:amino acid transporter
MCFSPLCDNIWAWMVLLVYWATFDLITVAAVAEIHDSASSPLSTVNTVLMNAQASEASHIGFRMILAATFVTNICYCAGFPVTVVVGITIATWALGIVGVIYSLEINSSIASEVVITVVLTCAAGLSHLLVRFFFCWLCRT